MAPRNKRGFGCRYCKFFRLAKDFDKENWDLDWKPPTPQLNTHRNIPPDGTEGAPILIVGEAPGRQEDDEGVPFVGRSGGLLERMLDGVRLDEKVIVTNLVRCRPPYVNGKQTNPTIPESRACSGFLSDVILEHKPKIIATLGGHALKAVLGDDSAKVTAYASNPRTHDVTVAGHKAKVFPLFHPSYILRNEHLTGEYLKQFKRLRFALAGKEKKKRGVGKYFLVRSKKALGALIDRLISEGKPVAFDFETNSLDVFRPGFKVHCVSLSNGPGKGHVIRFNRPAGSGVEYTTKQAYRELNRLFATSGLTFVAHNAKYDMLVAEDHLGTHFADTPYDTMLMHYVLEEASAHNLKDLAMRYTGMGKYAGKDIMEARKDATLDMLPLTKMVKYAGGDADATIRLYRQFVRKLKKRKLWFLVEGLMRRATVALMDIERAGAHVDRKTARRLQRSMDDALFELAEKAGKLRKVKQYTRDCQEALLKQWRKKKHRPETAEPVFEFNIASPKQLGELLFGEDYYGYDSIAETDAGSPSTDEDVLYEIIRKHRNRLAKYVVESRKISKLVSTYVEPVLERTRKDYSIIHANFNIHIARTGRLSSSEPNMQNITSKGGVKSMYRSRFKNGLLVMADYSQIELRIMAALSHDPVMLDVYRRGGDIHMKTCCELFRLTPEQYAALDKKTQQDRRRIAKGTNFGILYGEGPSGLLERLASGEDPVYIEFHESCQYIERWFETYPAVRDWQERIEAFCRNNEYVRSPFGRERRLPLINADNPRDASHAKRQAINHPIQSAASDITLCALVVLCEALKGMKSLPFLTVHDSIGFDCVASEAPAVVDKCFEIMPAMSERVPDIFPKKMWSWLDVPVEVEVEAGRRWSNLVEVASGAKLKRALRKLHANA